MGEVVHVLMLFRRVFPEDGMSLDELLDLWVFSSYPSAEQIQDAFDGYASDVPEHFAGMLTRSSSSVYGEYYSAKVWMSVVDGIVEEEY